jgi:hypothetical protein
MIAAVTRRAIRGDRCSRALLRRDNEFSDSEAHCTSLHPSVRVMVKPVRNAWKFAALE